MHYYDELLNENSPIIEQDNKIELKLKKHQLSGLCKAIKMEQDSCIYYKDKDTENYYKFSTNIGIIGEKVGYGKTITALAIIAQSPIKSIKINNSKIKTYNTYNNLNTNSAIVEHCQKFDESLKRNEYINTTLVIVPRGPVYTQWVRTIEKDTRLKALKLDDIRVIKKIKKPNDRNIEEIKKYFERYDLVLIKNTTYKRFVEYMNNESNFIYYWSRVMIDEAHDILLSIGNLKYIFMWLISATYHNLLHIRHTSNSNIYMIRDLIKNELNLMLIKSKDSFIKNSFELPSLTEKFYKCKMSNKLRVIREYLNKSSIERLDASDLRGLVRDLGGSIATDEGIVKTFTEKLKKDLFNKKCERNMIEQLHLTENEKEIKLNNIDKTIEKYNQQLIDLTTRLRDIEQNNCPICLDILNKPLVLNCTHSFCMGCIISSLRTQNKCPLCRMDIDITDSILLSHDLEIEQHIIKKKSKEDTLIDIINNNINGKFLIFSKIENGFSKIEDILNKHQISYTEIKGTTSTMNKILENFKNGNLRVILLNTNHAGSGIDISFASDVVIYHKMYEQKTQAIGRAYRVGRKEELIVHNLLYEDEYLSDSNTDNSFT